MLWADDILLQTMGDILPVVYAEYLRNSRVVAKLTFEKPTRWCLPVWGVPSLFGKAPWIGGNTTRAVLSHSVRHIGCDATVLRHSLPSLFCHLLRHYRNKCHISPRECP